MIIRRHSNILLPNELSDVDFGNSNSKYFGSLLLLSSKITAGGLSLFSLSTYRQNIIDRLGIFNIIFDSLPQVILPRRFQLQDYYHNSQTQSKIYGGTYDGYHLNNSKSKLKSSSYGNILTHGWLTVSSRIDALINGTQQYNGPKVLDFSNFYLVLIAASTSIFFIIYHWNLVNRLKDYIKSFYTNQNMDKTKLTVDELDEISKHVLEYFDQEDSEDSAQKETQSDLCPKSSNLDIESKKGLKIGPSYTPNNTPYATLKPSNASTLNLDFTNAIDNLQHEQLP
ncbi:hypothetical protein BN7_794 [Wickerhamomyces ciferrii]|uniref:Uncharacterized protein n=1 Tax=Wickerhamomyces ciferrii (strain ATCC 14091 / BCRC 22168 / CBS 111 / JCM 3599 / NBRC 0793 / NRRL Y-1031 F-60-10) TaxID=1206466 RepID=K0KGG0_WICCF|nr:uncharacterized protein BN7_794 [Wickerhamomyces ciferrii]CCH41257.1 hypothetical protein BN7_794 [Wickerhamomyces ciferrii]